LDIDAAFVVIEDSRSSLALQKSITEPAKPEKQTSS